MKDDDASMKLDHIAYAVRSTDDAIKAFSVLYPLVVKKRCLEESQNVYISYLAMKDGTHKIELVEPAKSPNPVENLLQQKKAVIYHLCYSVRDFDAELARLKKQDFFLVTEPFASTVDKGLYACHLFHPEIGIIEIVGPKR